MTNGPYQGIDITLKTFANATLDYSSHKRVKSLSEKMKSIPVLRIPLRNDEFQAQGGPSPQMQPYWINSPPNLG